MHVDYNKLIYTRDILDKFAVLIIEASKLVNTIAINEDAEWAKKWMRNANDLVCIDNKEMEK